MQFTFKMQFIVIKNFKRVIKIKSVADIYKLNMQHTVKLVFETNAIPWMIYRGMSAYPSH